MVALIVALVVTLAMTGAIVGYSYVRPADKPTTWGEAMVGSAFVFMLFVMLFGILPDQFIDWADNDLEWTNEKFLFTEDSIMPFRMDYQKLRDVIVVIEHIVALGAIPVVAVAWQKRGERTGPSTTSDFGRPLVKES